MQFRESATQYMLMNKDTAILSFLCARNEFDEPEFSELEWHVLYRPIGYKTLAGFLRQYRTEKGAKYRRV